MVTIDFGEVCLSCIVRRGFLPVNSSIGLLKEGGSIKSKNLSWADIDRKNVVSLKIIIGCFV